MFECHITIDPVTDPFLKDVLGKIVTIYGFKLAKLFMQKDMPSTEDTFMTSHSEDFDDLKYRMEKCIAFLKLTGSCFSINVRRYKIEYIMVDSKYDDEYGLL